MQLFVVFCLRFSNHKHKMPFQIINTFFENKKAPTGTNSNSEF
jgi:hypothetical protein